MQSSPHAVCGVQSRCCRCVAAAPAVHACPGTATRREPAHARLPAQRTLCLPGSGLAAQGIQCMRPGANVEPCCAGCDLQECSCSGRTNSTDGERVCWGTCECACLPFVIRLVICGLQDSRPSAIVAQLGAPRKMIRILPPSRRPAPEREFQHSLAISTVAPCKTRSADGFPKAIADTIPAAYLPPAGHSRAQHHAACFVLFATLHVSEVRSWRC